MKIACYASGSVGTNCYVVSDDAGVTAIIDCDGNPAPLFSYIEKNELKPTHILLTHGHFDHIGSVNEVAEKYGCTVVGCAKEMRMFTDASVNCSAFCGGAVTVYPDVQVNDGDVVKVGDMEFRVMLTPGHTEGSVCYISGSVMFSGDTLFQGSCGRTDLETGNWSDILKSLKKLAALPGDYQVYPGHGPSTTMEIERKTNPYM